MNASTGVHSNAMNASTGVHSNASNAMTQEFVVAMRAVATLRPNVNPEQKTGVLVAMQFVKRLKCEAKWPELVKAMRPVFVGGMM
eukprot:578384-Lingulodinium_polyedra.AAC.1